MKSVARRLNDLNEEMIELKKLIEIQIKPQEKKINLNVRGIKIVIKPKVKIIRKNEKKRQKKEVLETGANLFTWFQMILLIFPYFPVLIEKIKNFVIKIS